MKGRGRWLRLGLQDDYQWKCLPASFMRMACSWEPELVDGNHVHLHMQTYTCRSGQDAAKPVDP